jgi:ATP adenylyltransferase
MPMTNDSGPKDEAARPDPFGSPEPDFVVAETENHLLQLNKFCALRPQLLLHPKEFAPQSGALTGDDVAATWGIFSRLDDTSYVAFYNCGIESGSSQPYRHVQIIETPHPNDFIFFPDKMRGQLKDSSSEMMRPAAQLSVPFFCLVASVAGKSPRDIHANYLAMVHSAEGSLGQSVTAHNAVFTRDWFCVIPRRKASEEGCPANSMGMMGMIWVASDVERVKWDVFGLTEHLTTLGFPP